MRILVIEPYWGGSHQAFLQGLMKNIPADFVLLTLPARSWKKRMQLAAPWAAARLADMESAKRRFDVVLCSSFLDVALLRTLVTRLEGWRGDTRFLTYFHENQFVYPGRFPDSSIHQFCYLNFTSGLASDQIAFNSEFNRRSFLTGCRRYLAKSADMGGGECLLGDLEEKSVVLPPAIDFGELDCTQQLQRSPGPPVIIWNHRWEHDKGPEEFFDALYRLQEGGIDFRLVVLGQSFADTPDCFEEARRRLAGKIAHFGFASSRREYGALLATGDIVVSTARHEFFGISVLEAVRMGCRPLVPRRLSYPEIFDGQFLYSEGALVKQLGGLLKKPVRLDADFALQCTEHFGWAHLQDPFWRWLNGEQEKKRKEKTNRVADRSFQNW